MGHCDVGLQNNFTSTQNGGAIHYTWTCDAGTNSVSCNADYNPVCGDGSRNGNEVCDPNDPNKVGWGIG